VPVEGAEPRSVLLKLSAKDDDEDLYPVVLTFADVITDDFEIFCEGTKGADTGSKCTNK